MVSLRGVRWLSIVFAWLAIPAIAIAKPKVAVAPLDGDDDGKVAEVVVEAAREHAKVIGPKQVGKAADELGLSDPNTPRALKKLRGKLEVDAVIHGKVERDGGKKRLVLSVAGKGKSGSAFEVEYKSASSKSFKKELREELGKRIAGAGEGGKEDEADDEPPKKNVFDDSGSKKKPTDDEPPKKKSSDDDPPKKKSSDDDPPKKKKTSEDDEPKPKRVAKRSDDDDSTRARKKSSDDDEDRPRKKKKRRHSDDEDEPPPRHPITQGALWLDLGGAGLHRTLTYSTNGGGAPPPPVGTGSFSGQFEGEVYPFAFDTVRKPESGIGLAATFGRTVGLSITVPGTTASAGIDEGHYSIGARYRFVFGQSSLAAGISYWRREFIADRGSLMGQTLDMPDVDYRGIAPEVIAKFPATPTIGITAQLDVPLMLASGDITSGSKFGVASIIAFGLEGAVDVALAPHYGLRFAALFDQVKLSFQGMARGVTGATDRSMGITATFALLY
jgi:hypothetical protein